MRKRTKRGIVAVAVGVAMAASLFTVSSPAQASFPGTNGLIAYRDPSGNIFVVNPANPVPVQITNSANFNAVSFNAAANKLAASTAAGLVLIDPVAGGAVTPVPNTLPGDRAPSFSPAGDQPFSTSGGSAP